MAIWAAGWPFEALELSISAKEDSKWMDACWAATNAQALASLQRVTVPLHLLL